MEWYYANGDRQIGPVTDEQLRGLVSSGIVDDTTLVWRNGMGDWVEYGTLPASPPPPPAASAAPGYATCAECGQSFPQSEVVEYLGSYVCGPCKPAFVRRVQGGGDFASEFEYGGFWIRFVAKILDGIIVSIPSFMLLIPLALSGSNFEDILQIVTGFNFFIFSNVLGIAYDTFFIGKYGATLGKMAVGLKVLRPAGERITYLRAFGRHFAERLSKLILFIGYIMAAFDSEKRSLHDRICDTRVIHAR